MKNLRKTFFGSVVSLLICFTMLLGTTFAWFTDSVSSTGNVIASGTLDVDVLHLVDGAYVSLSENANHKVFNYDLWEPGYTQVETLKIENKGNLALRYQMTVFAEDNTEVLGANNENLADKIEVYMCFDESTATSAADLADTTKWWSMGTLTQYLNGTVFTSGKMLPAGATYNGPQLGQDGVMIGECVASIALHMSEDAGNEYQNLSLGEVYISLVATQWTFEEDSFDDQYDVNAWDELLTPITPAHTHSVKWAQDDTGETHTSYCDTNDCDGTFVATINEACADGNADNLCDKCGRDLTPAVCNHVDANHDGACDLNCGETNLEVVHDFSYGYCVCGQAPLFAFETDENNPVVIKNWFEQIFRTDTTDVAAMVTAMQTPNAQLVIKYVGEENVITHISIGAPMPWDPHGYYLGTPVSSEYDGTYRYVTYSNTDVLGVLAACKDGNNVSLLDQAASFAIEDNLPNHDSTEYVEANATKVYAVYVIIPNN